MDVDAIEPGVDFAAEIARAVASCDVLIALIGPTWTTVTDRQGRRKIEDPDDIVALEIRAALERDIRVIPVLVDGADMPGRYELPEELQSLVRRNAVRLDHTTFRSDVVTLLDAVDRILSTLGKEHPKPTPEVSACTNDDTGNKIPIDSAAEANNLGLELAEQGDLPGARAAYQQAIGSGHIEWAPKAAINLGTLLAQQEDVTGARIAYQQAIGSGHIEWAPKAAINLKTLLDGRRELVIEALSILRYKSGIYFFPDFPSNDRVTRIRDAASISPHEEIVVIVDLSLTSQGKSALTFGLEAIYGKNAAKAARVDYTSMLYPENTVTSRGGITSRLKIGDTAFLLGGIKIDTHLLGRAVSYLQVLLRGRALRSRGAGEESGE